MITILIDFETTFDRIPCTIILLQCMEVGNKGEYAAVLGKLSE